MGKMTEVAYIAVDLETWSSRSDAAIASIGAVFFRPGSEHFDTFSRNIYLDSCVEAGLHVGGETIDWWLSQSPQASDALSVDRVKLKRALYEFSNWCKMYEDFHLWSHATFDVPILGRAYAAFGQKPPWKYRWCRDLRTLQDLAFGDEKVDLPSGGEHIALQDALRMRALVEACYTKLGLIGGEDAGD